MAINVNTVYQTVLLILNKEQRGYMTPVEFNKTGTQAQLEIFETYFEPYWTGHYLIVDKNGNSVIIEFGEKDVAFIRKNNNYQVMTNFPNTETLNARWYNCYRYKTAESMLASDGEISTDLFRTICNAVHQEGSSPTNKVRL